MAGGYNKGLRLYLTFHLGVKCRHCDSIVLDPDKGKGQTYLRGKCPSCFKNSKDPQQAVDTTKLTKKQRKQLAKEAKRLKKAETRAARGKHVDDPTFANSFTDT